MKTERENKWYKYRKKACRALMTAVVLAGSAVAVAPVIENSEIVAYASTKTGVVNAGITNLRIRSSTDTSTTSNVITLVNGGFKFDVIESLQNWYKIGFYNNGVYTYGYISSNSEYVTVTENSTTDTTMNDKEFDEYLTSQGFPDSYKESLKALHAKYPKWIFKADDTGKNWQDVVDNENVLGRSLIYGSADTSWKSTADGAYDWDNNEWIEFDSGGYVQASDALVKYALDPRNYLNDMNIFAFEKLAYDNSMSYSTGLTNMLKGTFMENSSHSLTYDNKTYTYSSALIYAGQKSGVSPYHLATRIIQEQGTAGKSGSISGTVSGYEGYYNYFNQGAYKTSTASAVTNGLIYAKKTDVATLRPWNSRMKSIIGGAIYLGSSYINKGQNTLYYEKFDLVSPYYHQYMTYVLAPKGESQKAASAYSQTVKESSALVFTIPLYDNMPDSACPLPQGNEDVTVNGWRQKDGKWYYYENGALKQGWLLYKDNWYYLNADTGTMTTGWIKYENKWYYLNADGTMATGWIEDDDKLYYLNEDGIMQTGWIFLDENWYYLNSSGSMATGWLKYKNKWYYLNADGSMAIDWIEDDGKLYYLNENGDMATGWLKYADSWYYLNSSGSMATGWLKYKNKWYYLNEDGTMATGWIEDNGIRYYLNENGDMATGWLKQADVWYYLNPSGSMVTGWKYVNNRWYYMYEDGVMAANTWIDSYHVNENGAWDN